MKVSLAIVIMASLMFAVWAQEGAVKTSVVEEEMAIRSELPKTESEPERGSLLPEEEAEDLTTLAATSQQEDGASSVGQESQEELSVYTNPLTYYGYQESSQDTCEDIYNYYSLSSSGELREWE